MSQWKRHYWKDEPCSSCGFFLERKQICRKHSLEIDEDDNACPDFVQNGATFECTRCAGNMGGGRSSEELLEKMISVHGWKFAGGNLVCQDCLKKDGES